MCLSIYIYLYHVFEYIYIYTLIPFYSRKDLKNHPAKWRGFCSESLQINQAVLVFFCSHVTPQSWVNFTNCYMFNASSTSFCKLFEAILFFRTKHGHGDMVPGKKVAHQCTILTVQYMTFVFSRHCHCMGGILPKNPGIFFWSPPLFQVNSGGKGTIQAADIGKEKYLETKVV